MPAGTNFEDDYVRDHEVSAAEEPWCDACHDTKRRREWNNALDQMVDLGDCEYCSPTPEQQAAQLAAAERAQAEWERRVTAGENTYEDEPF